MTAGTAAPAALTADGSRCVGSGQCVLAEPRAFDQDDEGRVVVLVPNPAGELAAGVRDAVGLCPGQALRFAP
ncbi:ferredoxin [Streptomyces sp. NPDC007851]|uniref:ferredoxin n=1 Tax=Streptomyces sp. NPDC007851 TaxID=3155008 RepID=UPI0033E937AA